MQVVLLNFFLYAEDPVAHSETESRIPILGNVFSMIVTNSPANLYSALKVVFVIVVVVVVVRR